MGKVVTQYTNGEINSFKFKQELTANDIQIDPQVLLFIFHYLCANYTDKLG